MVKRIIDKLYEKGSLSKQELIELLNNITDENSDYLFIQAREVAHRYFDNKIYIRGLIEFSNYCKNDCYYCGIRKSNHNIERYHLNKKEILECCKQGYGLGFRTFVLQGGEDLSYSEQDIADIIKAMKVNFPDCAITLSIGEKSYETYLNYYKAGANRFLLRHETANEGHYGKLHPSTMSLTHRKKCLADLKKIGYQVGTGFMVGSPYQTIDNIAEDILFIKELNPQMVGIGPFIPHHDTPFAKFEAGKLELTLFIIGILRLMLPNALIPSTTALGTIDSNGREKGILAGANVVMPNLSPVGVRKQYALYDNKICTGDEAAECRMCLQGRIEKIGYRIAVDRGDFCPMDGGC